MHEYTASESLRKHMLAVEAAMRAYAEHFGEDPERWGLAGLIHDFDYERFPNADAFGDRGASGVGRAASCASAAGPRTFSQAILGHAAYCGVRGRRAWRRRCSPSTSSPG